MKEQTSQEILYCLEAGDGSAGCPMVLSDVSSTGARLLSTNPHDVPDRFVLVLKGEQVRIFRCHVAWRSDSHVGIEFDVPHVPIHHNHPK